MILQGPDSNVVSIVAIVIMFVVFPLVIGVVRYIWKRAGDPPRRSDLHDGSAMRLAQMQQSIDALAIEIERISEGQRFVTKLLSERDKSPAQLRDGNR